MPTISSEGQIFIPKFIRDVLSFFPGDEVDFQISDNQVFLSKKKHRKKCILFKFRGKTKKFEF